MADDDLEFPSSFEDDDLNSFDDDDPVEFDESEQEPESKGRFNLNRRYLLIGFVALALLCLVGIVIFRVFTEGGDEVADRPTVTSQPTDSQPPVSATVEETEPTPSPTRVIQEEPAEDSAAEPTVEPTAAAATNTPTPAPTATLAPTSTPAGAADMTVAMVLEEPGPPENQLENGDFEVGFDDRGVALDWSSFDNGGAVVSYSAVEADPLVRSGEMAQRISIAQASQPDRYAGLYQQMEVVPNQPYTLTLHGQIRTGQGSVEASSYGYRVQYAVDLTGGDDWRDVPAENWVELPWDEQPLDSPAVTYLPYTTVITPTSDQLTLFIRGWNKWPDPGLAEYTLDGLSLVGPSSAPVPILIAASPESPDDGDALMPVTGDNGPADLLADARFWGALLILLLLSAGAVYRGRWGY